MPALWSPSDPPSGTEIRSQSAHVSASSPKKRPDLLSSPPRGRSHSLRRDIKPRERSGGLHSCRRTRDGTRRPPRPRYLPQETGRPTTDSGVRTRVPATVVSLRCRCRLNRHLYHMHHGRHRLSEGRGVTDSWVPKVLNLFPRHKTSTSTPHGTRRYPTQTRVRRDGTFTPTPIPNPQTLGSVGFTLVPAGHPFPPRPDHPSRRGATGKRTSPLDCSKRDEHSDCLANSTRR